MHPAHLIILDLITVMFAEEYKFQSSVIMHSSQATPYFLLLRSTYSPQHPLLINVRGQISHPDKTTGKIIVLYVLIFKCLERRWEDKRF
jgi:hypothetical protein